jgi:hypothetical protein
MGPPIAKPDEVLKCDPLADQQRSRDEDLAERVAQAEHDEPHEERPGKMTFEELAVIAQRYRLNIAELSDLDSKAALPVVKFDATGRALLEEARDLITHIHPQNQYIGAWVARCDAFLEGFSEEGK